MLEDVCLLWAVGRIQKTHQTVRVISSYYIKNFAFDTLKEKK